jgi:hypothetical protein
MRKYIIFANLVLVIVFIFLGMKSYDSVKGLSLRKKVNIPMKDSNRDYAKARKYSRTSFMAGANHPINYYDVIPEKNLFRPERKEYKEESLSTEKNQAQAGGNSISPPAIDLYGIMIDKQKKVALLYDKREKEKNLRYKIVSTGAEIQGYTIMRIQTEQIILEKDGRQATIQLSQEKAARGGIMATGKQARTIIGKEETKKKVVTKPVSSKKDIPMGVPFIVQEGNVKYRVIKTPVGEKKIRIK